MFIQRDPRQSSLKLLFLSHPNLFSFVLHLHDLWKHNYWQIKIFQLKDPTLELRITVTPKTAVRWIALCIIIIPKINMWSLWVMAIMSDVTCGWVCVNCERMLEPKSAVFICITFRDLITSVSVWKRVRRAGFHPWLCCKCNLYLALTGCVLSVDTHSLTFLKEVLASQWEKQVMLLALSVHHTPSTRSQTKKPCVCALK